MPPLSFAMQIVELDAAARALRALAGSITAEALEIQDTVAVLVAAAPGAAPARRLPGLDLGSVADLLSVRARGTAERVADAAETYRGMEAALQGTFAPAGRGQPVPR